MTPAHFNFLLGILTLPVGLAAIVVALFFGAPALASLCIALFALAVYASLPAAADPVRPTPPAAVE